MQEIRTIILYADCIEALISNDVHKIDTLRTTLENEDSLENMLGCYHDSGQVSYEITHLQIDDLGKGFMEVKYIAHKYSGCRDIDLDEDDDMVIDININFETGETILIGPYVPERDPDDY